MSVWTPEVTTSMPSMLLLNNAAGYTEQSPPKCSNLRVLPQTSGCSALKVKRSLTYEPNENDVTSLKPKLLMCDKYISNRVSVRQAPVPRSEPGTEHPGSGISPPTPQAREHGCRLNSTRRTAPQPRAPHRTYLVGTHLPNQHQTLTQITGIGA